MLGAPLEGFPCTVADVCVKGLSEGSEIRGAGSSNNMMLLANRPNPNAAKLFVNWLLTKEGQTIMHTLSEGVPDQSLRTDVTDLGKTVPSGRRGPGRYVFFSSDPAYWAQREEALQYAKDAFNATH